MFYGLLTNKADQSVVEVAIKTIKGTYTYVMMLSYMIITRLAIYLYLCMAKWTNYLKCFVITHDLYSVFLGVFKSSILYEHMNFQDIKFLGCK